MLDGLILMWYILTALSLIYITYDLICITPEAPVMKVGWWLVTLYAGPIALFFYLLSCKEPLPGTHELFVAPLWKQALGSEVHCLAGDATGIIIAAIVLAFFHVPMALEIFIEYLAGFFFGWLIFQSLFMKKMLGGSYFTALKTTFLSEWYSMNMIMAGMIPVMVIWNTLDPEAKNPLSPYFWAKMSLATLVGGIIAFPTNRWLVKMGLKHGMMTIRESHESIHSHDMHSHKDHSTHKEHSLKATKGQIMWQGVISLLGLGIGILIAWIGYFTYRPSI